MKGIFLTAILQYHHSVPLGEIMNVGVLLVFPAQRQISFLYPLHLRRLTEAYPNVPEKVLKAYFKGISARVATLNQQRPDVFADLITPINVRQFVADKLLPEDSSVLQFGSIRPAVLYTTNITEIERQYRDSYLAYYQPETIIGKKDDAFLFKSYKDRLKETNLDLKELVERRLIHYKYKLGTNSQRAFDFDFAWENGSTNIVVPLSFDLQSKESILRKAALHFGKFSLLKEEAERSNHRFDVLVGKPLNPALHKSYDEAIAILDSVSKVEIIKEEQIDDYSAKTVAELQKKRESLYDDLVPF
jgi:Protein of unknown function (DUF3037)